MEWRLEKVRTKAGRDINNLYYLIIDGEKVARVFYVYDEPYLQKENSTYVDESGLISLMRYNITANQIRNATKELEEAGDCTLRVIIDDKSSSGNGGLEEGKDKRMESSISRSPLRTSYNRRRGTKGL